MGVLSVLHYLNHLWKAYCYIHVCLWKKLIFSKFWSPSWIFLKWKIIFQRRFCKLLLWVQIYTYLSPNSIFLLIRLGIKTFGSLWSRLSEVARDPLLGDHWLPPTWHMPDDFIRFQLYMQIYGSWLWSYNQLGHQPLGCSLLQPFEAGGHPKLIPPLSHPVYLDICQNHSFLVPILAAILDFCLCKEII